MKLYAVHSWGRQILNGTVQKPFLKTTDYDYREVTDQSMAPRPSHLIQVPYSDLWHPILSRLIHDDAVKPVHRYFLLKNSNPMFLYNSEKNVRKQYSNVLWSEWNNFWSKLNCYIVSSVGSNKLRPDHFFSVWFRLVVKNENYRFKLFWIKNRISVFWSKVNAWDVILIKSPNYLSEPRSDNLPYLKEIYGFRDDNIYLLHVQWRRLTQRGRFL